MARTSENSVEGIIREAAEGVVQRAVASIQRIVAAELASERVKTRRGKPGARKAKRRPRRQEMTKWVADRRARRVPSFVIEATGLDTKKKIVAKFGVNAAFERGRPVPPAKPEGTRAGAASAATPKATRAVKAKAPIVRKAAAAK